jgi:hypothetical protein
MEKGNYMKVSEVINYLDTKVFKFTLKSIVEKILTKHVDSGNTEYYSTEDLKQVIVSPLFRQMECHVITLMYNPKFDKSPINPQSNF